MPTTAEQIVNWVRLIKLHPKPNKIFFVDENGKCIINGKMVKTLPPEYSKFLTFDEFYLQVDPQEKEVLYAAFNIKNFITRERENLDKGKLDWEKMETPLCTFLLVNAKLITSCATPHADLRQSNKPVYGPIPEERYGSKTHSYPGQHHSYAHAPHQTSSYDSNGVYGDASYKEREAIRSKMEELLVANKTGIAIEYIEQSITKLCEEKKFSSLDVLLWSTITMDKMNTPALLAVLKATRGADHLLRDRRTFYNRTKERLEKIRAPKVLAMLSELEPGKEYPGITKYSDKVEDESNKSTAQS